MECLSYKASEILTLKSEAEDKIREDERKITSKKKQIELAKKLILKGFDNPTIADLTDLTTEEIRDSMAKE